MKSKSKELNKSKFSNNLYISESTCGHNHGLSLKCQKLKRAQKIFNTWLFNHDTNVLLCKEFEIYFYCPSNLVFHYF